MSGREEPYDPYIPSGGAQGESHDGGNQKTAALQAVCHILDFPGLNPQRGYMLFNQSDKPSLTNYRH